MCTVCGCSETLVFDGKRQEEMLPFGHMRARAAVAPHVHPHPPGQFHDHSHDHGHDHPHSHGHSHAHDHHYGLGAAGVSVPGLSQARLIAVETSILAKNDDFARVNRKALQDLGVLALNLVSSPGSGKTTLLCKTIEMLGAAPLAVIEGDQQTSVDADRIRATGAQAVQVNTGKGCHLDAQMVGHAMEVLAPKRGSYLFIENVGNLVCPAAFDLGEDAKVAILSVTEGEDKPLKYPDMFTAASLALINKTDLAPHCDADLDAYEANLRRINPGIEILRVSARTGAGMADWIGWLGRQLAAKG
jgi:hydrogenase nickel incorporation protein HypB